MSNKGKSKSAPGGARGGSTLMLIGFVLFAVSWFTPAYRGQDWFRGVPTLGKSLEVTPEGMLHVLDAPDWLPGWSACKMSWHLLTNPPAEVPDDQRWKHYVLGASCLTNLAMVIAMLATLAGRRGAAVALLMFVCAAIDAGWLYAVDGDPFANYRAGYYLWLTSFVLAGLGALAPAPNR